MRQGGKVAVVTGASTGIGEASARALRQAGYRVFGTSRRTANSGEEITMLTCDVTDDASVKAMVDNVLNATGRIDVLVNNAGMGLLGGAEESTIDQAQALFNVNLFGVIRASNAVLPTMRSQKAGRIINKLGPWPDTGPILGSLRFYEACARRLFGIPRSRGTDLRYSCMLA